MIRSCEDHDVVGLPCALCGRSVPTRRWLDDGGLGAALCPACAAVAGQAYDALRGTASTRRSLPEAVRELRASLGAIAVAAVREDIVREVEADLPPEAERGSPARGRRR